MCRWPEACWPRRKKVVANASSPSSFDWRRPATRLPTTTGNCAKAANDRDPSDFGAANVERLRLQLELAFISYERGKSLIKADPAEQTKWKINLLYDEVLRLNDQVERIGRGRLGNQ